ncbi:sulfite exporter TauE/SafE family protein [Pseudoruegeria sp. SK021]|uniref:sulfite exporter TauE/SafE family protein n=1 Tax=Pseudoruegeria sp. SK021 TaxID=1933035 RepID=UPI000A22972F|nr:sulfite exporter TauE/SafE family protein [Pseudoruegeria sp. SK021]OSP55102.1 hypothetical protein BV911_08705 [Pseudoruegeria sp. SK021]
MDVSLLSPEVLIAAVAVTLGASFVKGAIGFAMPMLMISGLTLFLPGEQALGALIVPTLIANIWQAFRGGVGHAFSILKEFRWYIGMVLVMIGLSAQLVRVLPQPVLFLCLGVPITFFAAVMLIGWIPAIPDARRRLADVVIGGIAGFSGGVSGVWGPPTVAYLAAIGADKERALRVQGVVYLGGAIVLLFAHLRSGVLNGATLPLSFAMVPPMVIGMMIGQLVQDRLDQARFRKVMLCALLVVGANLVRRGIVGFG